MLGLTAGSILLLQEGKPVGEYHFRERLQIVCNNAEVGGACQSNTSMAPEHCITPLARARSPGNRAIHFLMIYNAL